MRDYASIQGRILKEAHYLVNNKSTVRKAADKFGISKTTLHDDITNGLKSLGLKSECIAVRKVLDTKKKEAPVRGGMATRKRYATLNAKKSK